MLAFFLGSEADAAQQGLALTAPYVNMNSIVVRNKSSSFPSEGLVGAVIKGRRIDRVVFQAKAFADLVRHKLRVINAVSMAQGEAVAAFPVDQLPRAMMGNPPKRM